MEKSEAIRRFNEGKQYIETCLEQIASLELNNDKDLRLALMGTFLVKVSYKAHENFCKVTSYVINGKDGAQQLKAELICLKEKLVQLYDGADRQNLVTIKRISEMIISEIKEIEKWTGDHEQIIQGTNQVANNPIPETGENESLNTKKVKSLNKAEVMMAVKNEPFGPKKEGKPIQYKECYKRLTEGKIKRTTGKVETIEIIDKQYDLELFKYCVDRADISKIFKSRKKCYAIMFMNDIAEYYENPSEYRKAAVKAFHITKLNVGADGEGIRADYRLLMKNLFPDHANYQKKMPKNSK